MDFRIDFPALYVSHFWAEHHCVIPDAFRKGEPWLFRGWQSWCWLNFYRLKPEAAPSVDENGIPPEGVKPARAFHYRRSQIVLPQKAGKAPYTSAHICNEAVGPSIFAGWAREGDVYECAAHGCPCGWIYAYEQGEPKGVPHPSPLIQITATSSDQTDNIYDALRPMIREGPLSAVIPKVGEEFIRLPRDGEIAPVTSNAQSRLGQRVTFVPQDETGIYTSTNGMLKVADTQRRGLAGMGGRSEETTNGWDPTQDSQAQRTANNAAKTGDIFRFHPLPEKGLDYRLKGDRKKIHRAVYLKPTKDSPEDGTPWIDLDAIEGEAVELLEDDPAQAQRFFGNMIVAGGGSAFDWDHWLSLKKPGFQVPDGETIVIGVDGARYDDALAIVGCHPATGFIWLISIVERPDNLTKAQKEDYEHDRNIPDGAVREAFERWNVWRLYADPDHIDYLIAGWKNEFGERRVIEQETRRPRWIAWAVRDFRDAVKSGDVTHSDSRVLDRHFGNAKLQELSGQGIQDDKGRPMHTLGKDFKMSPHKMDAAMAAVLAWKARTDCIDAGIVLLTPATPAPVAADPPPSSWTPGTAPPLHQLVGAQSAPPGDIS